MMSIRRRLLLSLLLSFLVFIVIAMIYVVFQSKHELKEIFETNMKETAELLRDTKLTEGRDYPDPPEADDLDEQIVLQIWNKDGVMVHSVPQNEPIPLHRKLRDSIVDTGGRTWQTYTVKTDSGGFIQISRSQAMVTLLVEETVIHALIPFLVLFLLLSAGAWVLIGSSLSPLNVLSREIASRHPEQLDAIVMHRVPSEVMPLVAALNELLKRLGDAMEMQRRFTADAAHELRTPLTALRLQVDVLKKTRSDADRQQAVVNLEAGIDRAARLVGQLLQSSRVRAHKAAGADSVDLDAVIRSLIAEYGPLAERSGTVLEFSSPGSAVIRGGEEQVRSMIGNLIDNALRYGPDGGKVALRLAVPGRDSVTLDVTDAGPGIPAAEREKVFERFYRMPGTQQTGSGLGLSIVRDVAEQLGAHVGIGEGEGGRGARITVAFRRREIR